MIKYKLKLFYIVFCSIFGIVTFLFLQFCYEFHFYYMEQFQLFLYNRVFLADLLFSFGGLSEIIARWLLQFYILPKLGALITTILILSIALLMNRIARIINPNYPILLFPLLASVSTLFLHFNHNYYLTGTVAFILVLLSFLVYLKLSHIVVKIVTASFLTMLLFWWGGAVSILFVACVGLWEIFTNRRKIYYFIIPLAIAILLVRISVCQAWVGEFRFALLPDVYYQYKLMPPSLLYFSWIALLLTILFAFVSRKYNIAEKDRCISLLVQVGLVGVVMYWSFPYYSQRNSLHYKKLDYYARMQEWDNIIEESRGPLNNLLYTYYLDLALIEKNELSQRFFQFNRKGIEGLVVKAEENIPNLLVSSDLSFAFGDIAGSQHSAFECNVLISKSGSPRLYKRLVQTNLIFGEYSVAEKYIKRLEQTRYHKQWATEHRRFLNNDLAVEEDPLLGQKREEISKTNYFIVNPDIVAKVNFLVDANTINASAGEYLGCLLLLEKNGVNFMKFIQEHYSTEEALLSLPKSFQEGIIAINDDNPEQWMQYKISPQVIANYEKLKSVLSTNKDNPNLSKILYHNFGDTYWYYLMING